MNVRTVWSTFYYLNNVHKSCGYLSTGLYMKQYANCASSLICNLNPLEFARRQIFDSSSLSKGRLLYKRLVHQGGLTSIVGVLKSLWTSKWQMTATEEGKPGLYQRTNSHTWKVLLVMKLGKRIGNRRSSVQAGWWNNSIKQVLTHRSRPAKMKEVGRNKAKLEKTV